MTDFESRSIFRSRTAPSRQRLRNETLPLPLNSMSSLAIVRDLVKKVLRKNKKHECIRTRMMILIKGVMSFLIVANLVTIGF
jgi:hypothetical protein